VSAYGFLSVWARATLVFVAAILLLAAAPIPSPTATTSRAPSPLPAPSGAAAQRLDAFTRAWAAVTSYTATVTVFEQKDTQVQNVVFNYAFRKPASVTVHVASGSNAGVTLVWDGGTTVVAHRGSGLAALFKRTLSLHDPQATTIRGSSIDQLSFGAILAHAQAEAGTLSEVPGDVIDGVATDAVRLSSTTPAADAGLTREVVELSTLTHLPVRVLGYDGDALVRKIDFSNVTLSG
jgi:outer membrane lipoprotein-sorting protein